MPVARERIDRRASDGPQRRAVRTNCVVQQQPVDLAALRPEHGQRGEIGSGAQRLHAFALLAHGVASAGLGLGAGLPKPRRGGKVLIGVEPALQGLPELLRAVDDQRQPLGHRLTADLRGAAQRREIAAGIEREEIDVPISVFAQTLEVHC